MIIVSGTVTLKDASVIDALRPAMFKQIAASQAEEGCIHYSYGIDILDPKIIQVLEYWESWSALEAHFEMPHMTPWRAALKQAGILSRDIQAAETSKIKEV